MVRSRMRPQRGLLVEAFAGLAVGSFDIKSPAGTNKGNGATGHGNRYLARVLGEAAAGAGRTDTFLGARYRRIARRRGKKKAVVAVGRSIPVVAWHLLADAEARFADLGADYYDTRRSTATGSQHVRELEAVGYRVTLEPAARPQHPTPGAAGSAALRRELSPAWAPSFRTTTVVTGVLAPRATRGATMMTL